MIIDKCILCCRNEQTKTTAILHKSNDQNNNIYDEINLNLTLVKKNVLTLNLVMSG